MKLGQSKRQTILYRGRNLNQIDYLKGSYGSLDNSGRNPYLQSKNKHNAELSIKSTNKQKKVEKQIMDPFAKNTLKALDNQSKLQNHSFRESSKTNNRSISSLEEYNQLTLKKMSKLTLPKLSMEQNSGEQSSNNKFGGSISATLQVTTKKKKLQPLKTTFKTHYYIKTKGGSNGKSTKINQDTAIAETKLPFGLKMYCVCDGHGLNGHLVSSFIRINLIKNLTNILKKNINQPQNIQQIITQAIKRTNTELLACEINTQLSGSTFVGVFLYNQKIYCFNIGDSRAVLASYVSKQWQCKPLSFDLKPCRQDQNQRIIKAGGRIQCQKDEKGQPIGPLRVWIKDIQMPGLAMTRSFGDKAGIKAGTNAQPQITIHPISFEDKYIIVASDGIWEYIESQQAVKIINPYYMKNQLQLGAQRLVKISMQVWQKVSYSRDDITVVLVALNPMQK